MKHITKGRAIIGLLLALAQGGAAHAAAGAVGTVWADTSRFFFHAENANYQGCPQARFVLALSDKTRQSMVLAAQAAGRQISVVGGGCVNDGDTSVYVLYVH